MNRDQQERAKEIFTDAMERHPSGRAGYVRSASLGDAEVHEEVLRLLSEAETHLLSSSGSETQPLRNQQRPHQPSLAERQELAGRFRIEHFLGVGGMGEVYEALDRELQESVALKTIRPTISSSAEAIERFKAEVKESRRITNPSVCRVYDLFSHEQPESEPIWFLTMELLRGQTLHRALSAKAPLTLDQAIPLIGDMVSALSAAHAMGIVHRDFKPGNVMLVAKRGSRQRAVVTDFGLAMDVSVGASPGSTAGGGTPAYMAPEQLNGGAIGFEADQYAFGLTICEMLTGSRPELSRKSEDDARRQLDDWLKGQGRRLNARARSAIRRCLEFRPERRFRHIGDVLPILNGSVHRARTRWAVGLGAVFCAAVAALVFTAANGGPQVTDGVRVTPESGLSSASAISRDGKWIVYSSNRAQPGNLDIWIQPGAGGAARRLTSDPAEDNEPAISPDGKLVAFRSERAGGGLYLIGADGSGERLLAPGGWSPAFSPDGQSIAYWTGSRDDTAASASLFVISPQGGPPRRLAADFADARYPTFNSTGELLLFHGCKVSTGALPDCTEWWVTRADGSAVWDTRALDLLKAQKIELVTPPLKNWWNDLVIFAGARGLVSGLLALRMSRDGTHAIGVPRFITPGDFGEREAGIADSGDIVFGRTTSALHVWSIPLKRGAASATPVTDDPSIDGCPSISRDGKWLYFTRRVRGIRQLLVRELAANRESVVFASEDNKFWPVSSEKGDRAVFEVRRESDSSIWVVERGGQPRRICAGCSHPTSWFAGGKGVFYTSGAGEIVLLDLATGVSRAVLRPEGGAVLGEADWNPENEFLLFTSNRHGAKRAYAVRFPAGAEGPSREWIPLTDEVGGIDQPHWAADGRGFYFFSRRDASNCVWGSRFSVKNVAGSAAIQPFPVMHYHDLRVSPDRASPVIRGLTVSVGALYLSVGEVSTTLWLGKLHEPPLVTLWNKISFWR